uniref:Pentatricopeptide repeat-containing protein n=1 Tax=Oryza nivara TaxID=4536 RepID=A0A0E0GLE0_ORYNI
MAFMGQGAEALKLYKDMLDANLIPTNATFLLVLYACSHIRLAEEGRKVFQSMTDHFAIIPTGQLKEVFKLISEFPKTAVGPGLILLGACMVHKDSDLAQIAPPENSGYYVLLSNLLVVKKQISEAAAKGRKLVKLIEIVDKPNFLMAGDCAHPQCEAILGKS